MSGRSIQPGAIARDGLSGSVAFLLLGELFLIPHLLPIALALARAARPPRISLLVGSIAHEEIVRGALTRLGIANVEVRRVRGFAARDGECRNRPGSARKLLLLLLNAVAIKRHDVVVVAERTSLWLPRLLRSGAAFVYNEHGAGPHANFTSVRNRYAARILMPGPGMAHCAREAGHRDAPIEVVGYIKRDYIRELAGTTACPSFDENRPTVVYVPHWLEHKSSWWTMGEEVLRYFAASSRYNLVLAPHLRLPEKDPAFHRKIAPYLGLPHIHVDTTSYRLVDQSYINAADIYLGDGSSQVVEFAERPRPAIFLNHERRDWRSDPRFGHWCMGQVVSDIAGLDAALAAAAERQRDFATVQNAYVARMMGGQDGRASERAANVVLDVLAERQRR